MTHHMPAPPARDAALQPGSLWLNNFAACGAMGSAWRGPQVWGPGARMALLAKAGGSGPPGVPLPGPCGSYCAHVRTCVCVCVCACVRACVFVDAQHGRLLDCFVLGGISARGSECLSASRCTQGALIVAKPYRTSTMMPLFQPPPAGIGTIMGL